MKPRKFLTTLVLLGLVIAAGRYGWRRYTTPVPPVVPLNGASKEKIEKIESATEAVRRNGRSGRAWGELGLTLMANGFPDESVACFAHAERFEPTEPRWPYHQGTIAITAGRKDGFDKLRTALAASTTSKTRRAVLFTLARALVEDGQFEEAERVAASLRELSGEDASSDFVLALLAHGRGDRATARTHLHKLVDHPSARKRACLLLASLTDEPELARDYKRRGSELPNDPPWPDTFENELERYRAAPPNPLAPYQSLKAQGRHEEALALLQEQMKQSPDEVSCLTLGFDLIGANRFDEAARAYRQAVRLNPRSARAHMFLGVCLLQIGERRLNQPDTKDQAPELFREVVIVEDRAIALQNDLTDAHLSRGRALQHLGRTPEAIEAFRQAVRVGTEYAEMHQALGEALAESGQVREGLEHLENAVKLAKPNDLKPQQALNKWRPKAKGP